MRTEVGNHRQRTLIITACSHCPGLNLCPTQDLKDDFLLTKVFFSTEKGKFKNSMRNGWREEKFLNGSVR